MKSIQRSQIWLACSLAFVLVPTVARAQTTEATKNDAAQTAPRIDVQTGAKPGEAKPVDVKKVEPEPLRMGDTHDDADAHKEMERLFGEVERKLHHANRLLEEASAGGKRASAASNGMKEAVKSIDELLRESEQSGRDSIAAIDRILELANEHSDEGSCSGSKSSGLCKKQGSGKGQSQNAQGNSPSGSKSKPGSQSGSQPSGGQDGSQPSPLDRQGTATSQREATPQGRQPGGQEQGEQPGGKKPGQDGPNQQAQNGQPKGNQGTDAAGVSRPGDAPPGAATETVRVAASGQERWGELPEHTREIFRMQGGGDMPPRYREWIDAYYKRLNEKH